MWIVVTLIGGAVGIVIEILLTQMEDSGIQKACVIAGFFYRNSRYCILFVQSNEYEEIF